MSTDDQTSILDSEREPSTLERIDVLRNRLTPPWGLLNDREATFLESIRGQVLIKGSLSPGQLNWLSALEAKYSQSALQEEESWRLGWTDGHRLEASNVAEYYAHNPPYYSNYVLKITKDPTGFVLTKREWDKFCENKYAKRIRAIYKEDLKFKTGDFVQIRASNRLDLANYSGVRRNAKRDAPAVVVKQDAKPVSRAAKGSRIYSILVVGDTKTLFAHESDLKRLRRGAKGGKSN